MTYELQKNTQNTQNTLVSDCLEAATLPCHVSWKKTSNPAHIFLGFAAKKTHKIHKTQKTHVPILCPITHHIYISLAGKILLGLHRGSFRGLGKDHVSPFFVHFLWVWGHGFPAWGCCTMGVILTWTWHEGLGEKAKIISKQKVSEEWKVMLDTLAKAEMMLVRGCSYIT